MNINDKKLQSVLTSMGKKDISFSQAKGMSFIEFLLHEKIVSYSTLKQILATHFSTQTKDLTEITNIPANILPKDVALKYRAFAFYSDNSQISLAMSNPLDDIAIGDISLICSKKVTVFFADPTQISFFIDKYYNSPDSSYTALSGAVQIVDSIINSAVLQSASDIHIEPTQNHAIVRFRINGLLKTQQTILDDIYPNVLSRLKIMASLDIADSRFPKDGSFKTDNHKDIDFRISTLPTIFGEKVALRLIYKHELNFGLDTNNSGFSLEETNIIKDLLKNPNGAILVTGPTGSGKTTTLASFLAYINKEEINITTVEDPVENVMAGINHVSINASIGLDFSLVLRHILRQDPDIIMIGEIRDQETAAIVTRAALTGHLVLSTLHTNDAISTIIRLIDMGIEKELLADALKGVISQRLLRRLCAHCKTEVPMPEWLIKKGFIKQMLYQRAGCPKCFGTGFSGRFAIYEIVVIDKKLKNDILNSTWQTQNTLFDRAMEHLLAGNTSLEEVYGLIITQ